MMAESTDNCLHGQYGSKCRLLFAQPSRCERDSLAQEPLASLAAVLGMAAIDRGNDVIAAGG